MVSRLNKVSRILMQDKQFMLHKDIAHIHSEVHLKRAKNGIDIEVTRRTASNFRLIEDSTETIKGDTVNKTCELLKDLEESGYVYR